VVIQLFLSKSGVAAKPMANQHFFIDVYGISRSPPYTFYQLVYEEGHNRFLRNVLFLSLVTVLCPEDKSKVVPVL
jgi:hypothetical protein